MLSGWQRKENVGLRSGPSRGPVRIRSPVLSINKATRRAGPSSSDGVVFQEVGVGSIHGPFSGWVGGTEAQKVCDRNFMGNENRVEETEIRLEKQPAQCSRGGDDGKSMQVSGREADGNSGDKVGTIERDLLGDAEGNSREEIRGERLIKANQVAMGEGCCDAHTDEEASNGSGTEEDEVTQGCLDPLALATLPKLREVDTDEAIVCTPLALIRPESSQEHEMVLDSEINENMSVWVRRRVKGFGRFFWGYRVKDLKTKFWTYRWRKKRVGNLRVKPAVKTKRRQGLVARGS